MKNLCFASMLLLTALPAIAGSGMGNTLAAIRCGDSASNTPPPAGLYVADYLMTQGTSFAQTVRYGSRQSYFQHIYMLLSQDSKELAQSFKEFTDLYLNADESKKYVWEKPSFRLARDQKQFNLNGDGDLSTEEKYAYEDLPEHCKKDGKPALEIVIIKESPRVSGRPKNNPLFKYEARLLAELEASGPLQISMAIVHEWLWFHADNIRSVWRINRFLHSENATTMLKNQESILNVLRMMGFKENLNTEAEIPSQPLAPMQPDSAATPGREQAGWELFDQESMCPTGDFYSAEDMQTMIARNPQFMGSEAPMARDLKIKARMKTCDKQSGNCTSWVKANPEYYLSGLNSESADFIDDDLYFSYKLLGTTHWTVAIRKDSAELICEQSDKNSLGRSSQIICGHRPDSFLSVGKAGGMRFTLSGTLSKECVHLRSPVLPVGEVGHGKTRFMQLSVYKTFPAPLRRVQSTNILRYGGR